MTAASATSRTGPRVWAAAAVLGLLLRLAFSLLYWVDQPLTRDEREYLGLGRSLATGRGFVADPDLASADPFGRAPGYPVFLAAAGAGATVPTSVPARVKVLQSLVGAGGVIMIAMITARLAGARAARAAAWLAAVYPPLVWVAGYALSEAVFWPLALVAAWLFDRAAADDGGRPWLDGALAGLVIGIAILVRPGFLLFAPVTVLWLLWRRRLVAAVALGLGAGLILGPWTVRNYAAHGRLVVVASEGGITFWTGNHPRARGEGDLAANPDLKRASQALRAAHPELTEEQMEPIYYREALSWNRSHPLDWAVLELKKMFYLVVPIGPSYRVHSMRYLIASVVSFALLLPFGLAGWLRLGGARAMAPGVFLAAGSAILLCLIFFPQERFRIPSIDPALIVSAGALWRARGGSPA